MLLFLTIRSLNQSIFRTQSSIKRTLKSETIIEPYNCEHQTTSFSKKGDNICYSRRSEREIVIVIGEGFRLEGYNADGELEDSSDEGWASSYATTRIIATSDKVNYEIYSYTIPISTNDFDQNLYIVSKYDWEEEFSTKIKYEDYLYTGHMDNIIVLDPNGANVRVTPDGYASVDGTYINPNNKPNPQTPDGPINKEQDFDGVDEFTIFSIPKDYYDLMTKPDAKYTEGEWESSVKIKISTSNKNKYLPDKYILAKPDKLYKTSDKDYGSGLSGGAIAGIVIACIVVVGLIIFLVIFFCVCKAVCNCLCCKCCKGGSKE